MSPENLSSLSNEHALHLDSIDPLSYLRDDFIIPTKSDLRSNNEPCPDVSGKCIYFCGNSLGLQPKRTSQLISEELNVWAMRGVLGHHNHFHDRPWLTIDETVTGAMAKVVGALPSEVAVMGTLTSNIHFLLAAFYKPTKERHQIIIEGKAFPSDHYAVVSQLEWHGYDEERSLVTIDPLDESLYLTTQHILNVIDKHKESAAVIMLSGVQYYTGQAFDIETITNYAHHRGLIVGWDLAHAAGNVLLKLHEWKVDFAAWCSYKYINSGPGGIAGLFVHERHSDKPRLAGWWGHEKASRFQMNNLFMPIPGAAGFQHSNPSVVATICLLASLQTFDKTDMQAIRTKSEHITNYLETLLDDILETCGTEAPFEIITPRSSKDRGAQLSIKFVPGLMPRVLAILENNGVVLDERKPDVIRIAPAPLYNTFEEVWQFSNIFRKALTELAL